MSVAATSSGSGSAATASGVFATASSAAASSTVASNGSGPATATAPLTAGVPAGPTVTVSSTAALLAALKSAHSGETILLAAGTYNAVQISNINTPGNVTISAAKASAPPVINGLNVVNSSGITFQGLELSSAGLKTAYGFSVSSSSHITFAGLSVHGSLDGTPSDDIGGFYIHGSSYITIQNSEFQQFVTGITELNNSNISIVDNVFHNIETDGIDNGGSSYLNILGNSFTNFQPATSAAHPDAIQFWTTNTTTSAHDINISNNSIKVGTGGQVQGIFIKDQVGDLPYHNVTISNNVIAGELYNSISVGHADNLNVTNNLVSASTSVASNAENSPSTGTATQAWIGINDSKSVDLGGNDSSAYALSGNTGLVQSAINSINGVKQTPTMYSAVSATLGPLSNTLVLTGTQKINGTASTVAGTTVIANNAGDRLYDNGAGNQTLIGGTGNDTFISRYGSETLTGGGGNDTFNISTSIAHDVITDFGRAGTHDSLNISGFLTAGLEPILTNSGNNLVISFSGSSSSITLLGVHASDLNHVAWGFTH